MKEAILAHLKKTATDMGIDASTASLGYPEAMEHGDFSTNIALANAKALKTNPKALADKIVEAFKDGMPDFVESVSVAGAGFINFKIKDVAFAEAIVNDQVSNIKYQKGAKGGKKIMVEYTDPNPFKIFHIGHLMSNAIGESIARLIESSGAEVIRACYQGDVGLHVAKTISAMISQTSGADFPKETDSIVDKVSFLGAMYVIGNTQYEENPEAKKAIDAVNKKVFEKSDQGINDLYDMGRKWSLEYFDTIYARVGTQFDEFFFESEVADDGVKIVKEFLKKGVFTESEGAIVFKGEDHGVHTRVFITSIGLPTYEAKEIGLNTKKFEMFPDLDQSIIVTANEQSGYFKVLLKAFELIDPSIYAKTRHISHGLLRFASGKMSSRLGNVVPAETLIDDIKALVMERIASREFTPAEADEVSDMIAIAAIKYTVLRQAIGGDVIFDSAKSISFEGDSGPYLQYSAVRAHAILEKAKAEAGFKIHDSGMKLPEKVGEIERLLSRYEDTIAHARAELAPQHVATYLINLASAFNSYYAAQTIVDTADPLSPYRVELTERFYETMVKGLDILGIKVPKRM